MNCKHDGCDKSIRSGQVTGLCKAHWYGSMRKIPEGRARDYWWLQSRGMTKDEAIAHIEAGIPCERSVRIPTYGHRKVSTVDAVRLASAALKISARDVLEGSRFGFVVDCRSVVVQVMARQGMAYAEIGRRLKRDHSSIKHLDDTFAKRALKKPHLGRVVAEIMALAA